MNKNKSISGNVNVAVIVSVCTGFLLVGLLLTYLFFTTTIETGNVGVITNFGKITGEVLDSGWHVMGPIDHVTEISIRTINQKGECTCVSADQQQVKILFNIQTHITKENAINIYKNYGLGYMDQANPKIFDALQAETAKYAVTDIMVNRNKIRTEALKGAQARLTNFVEVDDLSLVNITFSTEYQQAIEAKQVAQQRAEQAKYELQQAQVEADKQIATAKGSAEAIQIKGDALAKNPLVLQLEIVTKWNGQSPQTLVTSGGGASIILPVGNSH